MIAACGLFRRSAWYSNAGYTIDAPCIAPGCVIPATSLLTRPDCGHRRLAAANATGNRIRCVHANAEGYEMRAVSRMEVSGFPCEPCWLFAARGVENNQLRGPKYHAAGNCMVWVITFPPKTCAAFIRLCGPGTFWAFNPKLTRGNEVHRYGKPLIPCQRGHAGRYSGPLRWFQPPGWTPG